MPTVNRAEGYPPYAVVARVAVRRAAKCRAGLELTEPSGCVAGDLGVLG